MLNSIKNIYRCSGVPVAVADKSLLLIWANTDELMSFMGMSVGVFFEKEQVPSVSGACTGIKSGVPYQYNVIITEDDECKYIIEFINKNAITDFLSISSIHQHRADILANIKNYIHGISTSIGLVAKVLEVEESYLEIPYLNIQVQGCYNILRAISPECELIDYVDGQTECKVINLQKYFDDMQKVLIEIGGHNNDCIKIDCGDNLFIFANEDRFTQALLSALVMEMKYVGKSPSAYIEAKLRGENIIINIVCGAEGATEGCIDDYSAFGSESHVDEKLDLILVKLFCDSFGGRYVVGTGDDNRYSVAIILPAADKPEEDELHSEKTKVLTDSRFSPFHIVLSEVFGIELYK